MHCGRRRDAEGRWLRLGCLGGMKENRAKARRGLRELRGGEARGCRRPRSTWETARGRPPGRLPSRCGGGRAPASGSPRLLRCRSAEGPGQGRVAPNHRRGRATRAGERSSGSFFDKAPGTLCSCPASDQARTERFEVPPGRVGRRVRASAC